MGPKSDSQPLLPRELGNGYSLSPIVSNGNGVTLGISGEIHLANADLFTDEVHSLIEGADGQVALDLENCLFIDSMGIRALLVLAREQEARGQRLKLSGAAGGVLRVLELTGVLDSGLVATGSDTDQKTQP